MEVYLIGSLRNPAIPEHSKVLRGAGIGVFDDWHAAGPEADDFWKKYEQERGRTYQEALEGHAARHVFQFDKRHLDRVDGAILALPAGRSGGLEFGYVIGTGRPGWVFLDSPDRWDVMVQFANGWSTDMNEIVEMINEWQSISS